MQIPPSTPRFSAGAAAIGAPVDVNGAGFASLLRQRLPTPEPTLAAPARTPTPAPAAPESASPAPALPATAPTRAAAAKAPDAAPANGPAPAAAPAGTEPAADAAIAPTLPAQPTASADAALRAQLRARLRAVDAPAPDDLPVPGAPAGADAEPATAVDPDSDVGAPKKSNTAASTAAAVADVSPLLPSLVSTTPSVTPPTPDPLPPPAGLSPPPGDAQRGAAAARDATATADTDARTGGTGSSTEAPASGAPFAGLLAEHRSGAVPGDPARARPAVDAGAPAAVGAAAFGAAPLTGTAVPQAVAVATPVNAPNFAQQLGVQLSVLARGGVQQAELHLNPADLGPVSVQITLDGTQARIDFGADVAATRHAIESGLPQLAGALADAGFTLAGGGVSSHAGGRGDGGGRGQPGSGHAPTRAAGIAATEAAAPAVRRVVSMGGLDLYA